MIIKVNHFRMRSGTRKIIAEFKARKGNLFLVRNLMVMNLYPASLPAMGAPIHHMIQQDPQDLKLLIEVHRFNLYGLRNLYGKHLFGIRVMFHFASQTYCVQFLQQMKRNQKQMILV